MTTTESPDRLTTAAPRMLNALRLCVDYMSSETGVTKEEAFIAAQKAIAHATGEIVCLGHKVID